MSTRSVYGKKYEMDMCQGPIFSKLVLFVIPLILSSMLQLLFNAADVIVVGRFSGSEALAAVGSTSSIVTLTINLFIGLSVGVNVLAGRYYGAHKVKDLEETVHTAVLIALAGGTLMIGIAQVAAPVLLERMGTPENVFPLAVRYIRVYFFGIPMNLLYNYGSGVLRAVGDTRRPMYYLMFAGVINVLLNLFFVIVLHMNVAGVALATILSQTVSAALVMNCLMKTEEPYHVEFRKLCIVPDKFLQIIRIGIPSGIQGSLFSISNILVQSSVNSFGPMVVAGNSAAKNIEGFVDTISTGVYQTALSFTSQNYGAGKWKRITRIQVYCMGLVAVLCLLVGGGAAVFSEQLMGIYSSDPQVITYGMKRLQIVSATYFLGGMMSVMTGGLRGLGYAIVPMFVSVFGICVLRVLWIFTVFATWRSQEILYLSYPISWVITMLLHILTYILVRRRLQKKTQW